MQSEHPTRKHGRHDPDSASPPADSKRQDKKGKSILQAEGVAAPGPSTSAPSSRHHCNICKQDVTRTTPYFATLDDLVLHGIQMHITEREKEGGHNFCECPICWLEVRTDRLQDSDRKGRQIKGHISRRHLVQDDDETWYRCHRCTNFQIRGFENLVYHARTYHEVKERDHGHVLLKCPLCLVEPDPIRAVYLVRHLQEHKETPFNPTIFETKHQEVCAICLAEHKDFSGNPDDLFAHAKSEHYQGEVRKTRANGQKDRLVYLACPICTRKQVSTKLLKHIKQHFINREKGTEASASRSLGHSSDRHSSALRALLTPSLSCAHARQIHPHFTLSHLWKNSNCRADMGMAW